MCIVMRVICKILVFPFALALTLAVLVLSFFRWISEIVLNALCGLCVISSLFALFIEGDSWGVQGLVIAFCVSPFGLPYLADCLLNWLDNLSGSMWGYIMA